MNPFRFGSRICLACLFPVIIVHPAAAIRTRLTWVNGIGHSLEHMEHGKLEISKLFGGKRLDFCHNPTAKKNDEDMTGYIWDLSQAGTQKLGYITEEVNILVK